MLLRLHDRLPEPEVESILRFCKELGYRTQLLDGAPLEGAPRYVRLEGGGRPEHRARLEDLTGVREVVDVGRATELHARMAPVPTQPDSLAARPDSCVSVGQARFGGGRLSLIAGPCAIESAERLREIAGAVRAAGATLLRGGAFKPRTSPYSFQGLGRRGLQILREVRAELQIGVVTEVLDPRDVGDVGEVCDMFQIGARSMTNQVLLREVGKTRKPVLLKRSFGATVAEFLSAAEYVLAEGNESVVLCERGIRGFDSVTRNLLDVGAVAHLVQATHLPVIVDPSHAAGRADLVRPLARAGLAAGADGLMIEVHTQPFEVHSDGEQAISAAAFREIVGDARSLARLDGRELVTYEESFERNGNQRIRETIS